MYTYLCEHSETTCSACSALDGKQFNLDDAAESVNLPPMHPNCRCTVAAYPPLPEAFDLLGIIGQEMLENALDLAFLDPMAVLYHNADLAASLWKFFFDKSVRDYYGVFTTIEVGGTKYQINRDTFSGVALGPDGALIVPENAKLYDQRLLALMKQRDALPEESNERAEVERKIEKVYAMGNKKTRSIDPKKPYSFYILGGDVTEQLNAYMRQTERDYANMHKKTWPLNLSEFKSIVDDFSTMDLKRQPEWQHSAYIYDGEIVDQDVPGNINYGYFGTFCNIPVAVLLAGAGYAQVRDKNSAWEFWFTLFDDPRDSYRVMHGIEIYSLWH